jgi:hypothetical protein
MHPIVDHPAHDTMALGVVYRLERLLLIRIARWDSPGEIADHARGVSGRDGQTPAIFKREAPAGQVVEHFEVAV